MLKNEILSTFERTGEPVKPTRTLPGNHAACHKRRRPLWEHPGALDEDWRAVLGGGGLWGHSERLQVDLAGAFAPAGEIIGSV